MKKILLLTFLIVLFNARLLDHLATTYQTCCPESYVLEPK